MQHHILSALRLLLRKEGMNSHIPYPVQLDQSLGGCHTFIIFRSRNGPILALLDGIMEEYELVFIITMP